MTTTSATSDANIPAGAVAPASLAPETSASTAASTHDVLSNGSINPGGPVNQGVAQTGAPIVENRGASQTGGGTGLTTPEGTIGVNSSR